MWMTYWAGFVTALLLVVCGYMLHHDHTVAAILALVLGGLCLIFASEYIAGREGVASGR